MADFRRAQRLLGRVPAGMEFLRRELAVAVLIELIEKRSRCSGELIKIDTAIVPEIDQR